MRMFVLHGRSETASVCVVSKGLELLLPKGKHKTLFSVSILLTNLCEACLLSNSSEIVVLGKGLSLAIYLQRYI